MYFQKPLQRPHILRVQIPVLGVLVVAVGKRETSSRHKSSSVKCSIPLKLLISKFLNPSIIGYLMFNLQIYSFSIKSSRLSSFPMRKSFSSLPLHFLPQSIRAQFHPAKSEPFLAQVLQRGAEVIYRVVDAEEAVMCCLVSCWEWNGCFWKQILHKSVINGLLPPRSARGRLVPPRDDAKRRGSKALKSKIRRSQRATLLYPDMQCRVFIIRWMTMIGRSHRWLLPHMTMLSWTLTELIRSIRKVSEKFGSFRLEK